MGDPEQTEIERLRLEAEHLRSRIAQLEAERNGGSDGSASRLFERLLQLPLLFFHIGTDGRFRDVAGRATERIHLDPAELLGREVFEVFPEAQSVILETLAGNTVSAEGHGVFQGHPWAALTFLAPAADGGGTIGMSLDITEWKRSRGELAASERRFRSLAETVAVAISRSDLAGTILYANEPMAGLLGIPTSAIIGHNSLDFVHEDDRERIAREWLESADPAEFAGIFRIRTGDGRATWVLGRSAPERNEAGEMTGLVSSLVDISERKRVEESLSRRVAERTVQLEQANKELEAFCYSVSHDLRAPLRSIDGFCRLLAEELGEGLPEQGREYLGRVLAATTRMDHLIDDFLALSRASLGELSRTDVDLSDIAGRIAEDLALRRTERGVKVVIAPGLAAHGDPTLLADAMENLLSNAFKFTARTPEACIEFFATRSMQEEQVFVVRDNGAGFDMQQASKLFTAFHRLHDDRDFEGTGVGLATVERIIQRHGGRIWAEASPGRGASFMFTIPRPDAAS